MQIKKLHIELIIQRMSQMNKIIEKVILDKEHQTLIKKMDNAIKAKDKEIFEMKNIETQHQRMNGLLHEEIAKLNKEIFQLKKDNAIFKENIQAEHLRGKK